VSSTLPVRDAREQNTVRESLSRNGTEAVAVVGGVSASAVYGESVRRVYDLTGVEKKSSTSSLREVSEASGEVREEREKVRGESFKLRTTSGDTTATLPKTAFGDNASNVGVSTTASCADSLSERLCGSRLLAA